MNSKSVERVVILQARLEGDDSVAAGGQHADGMEPAGRTKPEAGVTATRPATRPVAKPRAVGLPLCSHSTSIQLRAAAAAADWDAARGAGQTVAVRPLPPLKPNQPNQSRPAAEQRQGYAVGVHGVLGIAEPLAQHRMAARPNARRDVNDRAAGEIEAAQLAQPARRIALASTAQTQCASGA